MTAPTSEQRAAWRRDAEVSAWAPLNPRTADIRILALLDALDAAERRAEYAEKVADRLAGKLVAAQDDLPMTRCPGCGEVKWVGHGPLCGACFGVRVASLEVPDA